MAFHKSAAFSPVTSWGLRTLLPLSISQIPEPQSVLKRPDTARLRPSLLSKDTSRWSCTLSENVRTNKGEIPPLPIPTNFESLKTPEGLSGKCSKRLGRPHFAKRTEFLCTPSSQPKISG